MRQPKPAADHVVPVAITVGAFLSASETRRSLLFSVRGADVYISPDPAMVLGNGLRLVNGQVPTEVCACHQGTWICKALFAIADGAPATVYIIEGFDDPWPSPESPSS